MNYSEIKTDLFSIDKKYVRAHCISTDCAMGAGIAKQFTKVHKRIKRGCLDFVSDLNKRNQPTLGRGFRYEDNIGVVYNIFTKEKYWQKANQNHLFYQTYLKNLKEGLLEIKFSMIKREEKYLAIPLLGSGLDRCKWEDVKEIVKSVFEDTDITIVVAIWK